MLSKYLGFFPPISPSQCNSGIGLPSEFVRECSRYADLVVLTVEYFEVGNKRELAMREDHVFIDLVKVLILFMLSLGRFKSGKACGFIGSFFFFFLNKWYNFLK